MAQRSFSSASFTPVAVADATNFTNLGYMAIQGGSSTQRTNVNELFIGGQATATAPTILQFGRDSTVGASLTALTTGESDAALDPATAALAAPVSSFTQSSTKPQRSSTLGRLLNLSFNAFGGLFRWYEGRPGMISMLGNTASLGELSLSAFTGGGPGLMGAHIVYEPL